MAFGAWNQLDEIGLYIGLDRLEGEVDELYFRRIKLFSKWLYRTDYKTQTHSIPIQAGLNTFPIARISSTHPFECTLDWEYLIIENFPIDPTLKEYYRIFININESVMEKIALTLAQSQSFTFEMTDSKYRNIHHHFIIRSKNTDIQTDYISTTCSKLTYNNLLSGTFDTNNKILCKTRRTSLQRLKHPGDYFLDEEAGYLQTFSNVDSGFRVTYKYYRTDFVIEGTELNLVPLSLLAKYGVTDDLIYTLPYVLDQKVWGK